MADFGTGSLSISYCDGHLASVCFEKAWASMLLIVKFCTIMLLAPRGKRGLESYPWADWGFQPWIMLLGGGLGDFAQTAAALQWRKRTVQRFARYS